MIAVVQIPLWTLPAAFCALCWAPDGVRWVARRLRARVSAVRRLRALDELWSDEVGVAVGAARLAERDSLRTTATPTMPWPWLWPRVTVYRRVERRDDYSHLDRLIDEVRP